MSDSLSVVIPAYNEEANLPKCISNVYSVLKKTKFDWEIIIVDDGSKDKTGEIADDLAKKYKNVVVVHNQPNRGYGGSLKAGFAKASKNLICFFPADNQFDISQLSAMLKRMESTGADMVSGIRENDSDPTHRKFVRWLWNTGIRALFGYLASDIDCGFKVFKREVLEKISIPSNGAMIDTEILAGMRARGMKIDEMPVIHLPRTAGTATGGNFKVWIKAWHELVIFWWQLRQELLVERGKAVFKWEAISILIIVLVASFLRFYKIGDYMTFLGDEGRDAVVVRDMILGRKFTLLGPGTSVGNMYLGPLYYYLMIPALALANFSPVGPSVMVGLFGIATVFLIWWIGRQWFDRVSALAVTILYAISPTVITYSRSSWNPNIMPFFALLSMYAIWKVWRYGYWRWLIISAISFAFVLNSHYLGLLLLPMLCLFWFLSKKTLNATRYTLISIFTFLILMSPLLFFDLRHNFMNFKNIKLFFTDRQTTVNLKIYKAIPNLWTIWEMIISSLVVAKNNTFSLITSIFILIGLGWVIKKKPAKDFWFISIWVLVGVVGLGLYKQHIYDHYFGFLYPAIFLLLGFVLSKLNKFLALIIIMFFMIINVTKNPLYYPPNNQWKHTQDVADFIIGKSDGQPFNLALLSKSNYDMSYRYALSLKNSQYKTLLEQNTSQLFVICEDPDCKPVGNPLWEIAGFGWVKIDEMWIMPWGVKIYKLGHYEK